MTDTLAIDPERHDNAQLMEACRDLGYLRAEWTTLDPTWGRGAFWTRWRPDVLIGTDGDPALCPLPSLRPVDFTALPFGVDSFDVVVFDPPYKLNGTPAHASDEQYGVHVPATWQERHALIHAGLLEASRVAKRHVFLKCQAQVCSGQVRWQDIEFTNWMDLLGWRLEDRLDLLGMRAQPPGRRQLHARRNHSTLLIFTPTRRTP